MARPRQGLGKRERERLRTQRQEAKKVRREAIAAEPNGPDGAEEARLMDEFRVLSERHAAGGISEMAYANERRRIFDELGIEQPHD
jgi:hypothetical protein